MEEEVRAGGAGRLGIEGNAQVLVGEDEALEHHRHLTRSEGGRENALACTALEDTRNPAADALIALTINAIGGEGAILHGLPEGAVVVQHVPDLRDQAVKRRERVVKCNDLVEFEFETFGCIVDERAKEVVLRGEITVDGPNADARALSDRLHFGIRSGFGEDGVGSIEEAGAVGARVAPRCVVAGVDNHIFILDPPNGY